MARKRSKPSSSDTTTPSDPSVPSASLNRDFESERESGASSSSGVAEARSQSSSTSTKQERKTDSLMAALSDRCFNLHDLGALRRAIDDELDMFLCDTLGMKEIHLMGDIRLGVSIVAVILTAYLQFGVHAVSQDTTVYIIASIVGFLFCLTLFISSFFESQLLFLLKSMDGTSVYRIQALGKRGEPEYGIRVFRFDASKTGPWSWYRGLSSHAVEREYALTEFFDELGRLHALGVHEKFRKLFRDPKLSGRFSTEMKSV